MVPVSITLWVSGVVIEFSTEITEISRVAGVG